MSKGPPAKEARLEAIWRVVSTIPGGCVVTYGDVALAANPPCSARHVGWALRMAHPAQGLPWHRVVAAGGRIALQGLSSFEQRLRLEAEGVKFRGRRVRMDLHHFRDLTPSDVPADLRLPVEYSRPPRTGLSR